MIRGTTPTHTFTIPFNVSQIKDLRISYAQGKNIILVKTIEDCILNEKTIKLALSQEDTLKFLSTPQVKCQVKILTTDDTVLCSKIKVVLLEECLNEEVLK